MTFTMHCVNIWHKIKEETVHVWNRTEQIDIRICSQISISDNQVCNCVHPTIMLFLDYRITSKQGFVFFFGIPGPIDEDKTCKQSSAPISSFPSCHLKFFLNCSQVCSNITCTGRTYWAKVFVRLDVHKCFLPLLYTFPCIGIGLTGIK